MSSSFRPLAHQRSDLEKGPDAERDNERQSPFYRPRMLARTSRLERAFACFPLSEELGIIRQSILSLALIVPGGHNRGGAAVAIFPFVAVILAKYLLVASLIPGTNGSRWSANTDQAETERERGGGGGGPGVITDCQEPSRQIGRRLTDQPRQFRCRKAGMVHSRSLASYCYVHNNQPHAII